MCSKEKADKLSTTIPAPIHCMTFFMQAKLQKRRAVSLVYLYMLFVRQLILVSLFLTSMNLFAQTQFQRIYSAATSQQSFCIRQTNDGGFIVCGNISVDTLNSDFILIKISAAGDTLWKKHYGGTAGEFEGIAEQTTDGGYVMVGSTHSYGAGVGDILVIKTDQSGDTLWARTYGGSDDEIGQCIRQTFDGGYIIGGHSDSFGPRGDFYLIRTNASGDTLWTRNYGGPRHDHAFCVQQTSDSGFIMVGHSLSFGTSGGFYAVKTNSAGDTLWTRGYGGLLDSYCYSVFETSDGYLMTGTTLSFGAGGTDAMVVKTDHGGTPVWTRTYGTPGEEYFNCVKASADGNFILAGSITGGADSADVLLVKIDANGDTLWTRAYGGIHDDEGMFVEACADSGYVVGGLSNSFSGGVSSVYLVRTDKHGNSGCLSHPTQLQMTDPGPVLFYVNTSVGIPPTQVQRVAAGNGATAGTITDVCAAFGIEEMSQNPLEIFPSPASRHLYLSTRENLGLIRLIDSYGRCVFTENISLPKAEISLDNFLPGLYIVEAAGRRMKFVKE
jgi:hypothetical protein